MGDRVGFVEFWLGYEFYLLLFGIGIIKLLSEYGYLEILLEVFGKDVVLVGVIVWCRSYLLLFFFYR